MDLCGGTSSPYPLFVAAPVRDVDLDAGEPPFGAFKGQSTGRIVGVVVSGALFPPDPPRPGVGGLASFPYKLIMVGWVTFLRGLLDPMFRCGGWTVGL